MERACLSRFKTYYKNREGRAQPIRNGTNSSVIKDSGINKTTKELFYIVVSPTTKMDIQLRTGLSHLIQVLCKIQILDQVQED